MILACFAFSSWQSRPPLSRNWLMLPHDVLLAFLHVASLLLGFCSSLCCSRCWCFNIDLTSLVLYSFCAPAGHLQESRDPPGRKPRKKSQQSLPAQSLKKSRKGRKVSEKTLFVDFSGAFRPFRDFFETLGRKAQEGFFETLSRFSARRASRLLWMVSKDAPTASTKLPPIRCLTSALLHMSQKASYEQRRKLLAQIPANLVFQACISFLRCFRASGTPTREILVYPGMLPRLVP